MVDFFASLYEWGGLNPLYSKGMGDFLRGWDVTGTGFIDTPWYVYIGLGMFGTTAFIYSLQYHIIDSSRFMQKKHWWLMALLIMVINFLIAFIIPYNVVQTSSYDPSLKLTMADCFGVGLTGAINSLFVFAVISSIPWIRSFSTNCRNTTFWKP